MLIHNFAVAVMAATVVGFLTFVTVTPSNSAEEPLLMRCDVDPTSTDKARRFTCTNVLELPAVEVSAYGNSNEDPNDPSNDPKRNHDER